MTTRAWLWLRSILFRARLEREMQEEMSAHLRRSIERFAAAGLSPDAARAAAHQAFGNVAAIEEEARDVERRPGGQVGREFSYPEYRDYASQTALFASVAAWTSSDVVLGVSGSGDSGQERLSSGARRVTLSSEDGGRRRNWSNV